MTRSIALAEKARASYSSLAAEHLSKLFLRAHELSLTDDASMTAAISGWLQNQEYERLDSELDTLSTYCALLRDAIEASLVELQTLRDDVVKAVDSSTIKCLHSASVTSHDDVEIEGIVDKGMEALFAGANNSAATHTSMALGETKTLSTGGDFDSNQPHSMLRFIVEMGKPGTVTSYRPTQLLQMLNKCEAMLQDLPPKVQHDTHWVKQASMDGKAPADVVNEMVAAFLYSVDAKDCDCRTVRQCLQRQLEDSVSNRKHRSSPKQPTDRAALGWNGNHWAMMNWVDRVAADPIAWELASEATEQTVRDAVRFFAPLRDALNNGLRTFPAKPRVVFRGITVPVAHKYTLGTEVTFAPFTSTSLEGGEALKFMRKGGTYFVISTHSGALIADFSHYPEQAEALLRTNTEFVVTSKMSRTLQQMLENDFDVVFMSEKHSRLSPKETITQLVEGTRTTEFVYTDYTRKYVEGRVSHHPPPTTTIGNNTSHVAKEEQQRSIPLFKATTHFVNGSSLPFMLLLGAGGAGKTSALVGCLCHLMRLKSRHSRPLLPLFISLPSVGLTLHVPRGLDTHLQQYLRLDDATFQLMLTEVRVVLLLDSLDEVAIGGDCNGNGSILTKKLLDMNPWCSAVAKVIVSCRTEFLDTNELTAAKFDTVLSADGSKTEVYHVWPFNDTDRQTFMRQAASDRIEELARREADTQYAKLRDTFQLTDAQLSHPCVLHIATKVLANLGGNVQDTAHNMYTLYDNFVRGSLLAGSSMRSKEAAEEKVLRELRLLAHTMSRTKVWHIPVREIRNRLSKLSDEIDCSCDELLSLIPSRCEDLHNPNSLWSFWHKTVAEFLAAQALKDNPSLGNEVEEEQMRDADAPRSAGSRPHPTDAGVTRMMELGSTLDEYIFVPNPANICEALEEQLRLGKKHIDMRAVIVKENEFAVDGENEASASIFELWCRKYLCDARYEAIDTPQKVRLSLPTFSNVTKLTSVKLGLDNVDIDLQNSLPSVSAFEEEFEIQGCRSVLWPAFPLVKALPRGFKAHGTSFPPSSVFPNVDSIGDFTTFDMVKPNGGLTPGCFPKVPRMPHGAFTTTRGKIDIDQLPHHWQNTYVVQDNDTFFDHLKKMPTTIDFRECTKMEEHKMALLLRNVRHPAKVIPPRWAPSSQCFCAAKSLDFYCEFPMSATKLQLDMTECFSEYTIVRMFHVKGKFDELIMPQFLDVKKIDKEGLQPQFEVCISIAGARKVVFHPTSFGSLSTIPKKSIRMELDVEDVVLPQFSSVKNIDDFPFLFNTIRSLTFASDSFGKCEKIGNYALCRMENLHQVSNFPAFKQVESVGDSFYAENECPHQLTIPSDFFISCQRLGSSFMWKTQFTELVLPSPFLPLVSASYGNLFNEARIDALHGFDKNQILPSCNSDGRKSACFLIERAVENGRKQ